MLALGLSAGLAGTCGLSFASQYSVVNEIQVGYWIAKETSEQLDLDEDEANTLEAVATGAGASAGLLTGAVIGAKVGSLGGPIGTVIGVVVGGL